MLSSHFSPISRCESLFPERPAIKLHEPAPEDDAPPAASSIEWPERLTVRAFFELIVLPDLKELVAKKERKPATVSAYCTTIKHWEKHSTQNPVLFEITADARGRFAHIEDWKAAMDKAGYSAGSINKYWRNLRTIFRRAASPADRNPKGLGLIARVPYMSPAKGPLQKKRRFVGDDELSALYASCENVRPGRKGGADRKSLLRLAIVVARTYGPRTRDIFALHGGDISFDPRNPSEGISFDRRHPDPSMTLESPLGWFSFTAEKTGVRLVLPISRPFRTHLEAVGVKGDGSDGQLFPPSFLKSNNVLYRTWDRIAAGARERMLRADPTRKLPHEPACFQDLRKTANTLWKSLHPELNLGRFVLGHKSATQDGSEVNEEFYTERAVEVVNRLFLPREATDLQRHFAWKELPAFLTPPKQEPTLF